jgi:FkbM family methyltransferase
MKSVDFKKRVSRSLTLYRILQKGLGPFLGFFSIRQVFSHLLGIISIRLPLGQPAISIRCWADIVSYMEIFQTAIYDPVFLEAPIETYCDLGCQSGFALFRLGSIKRPPVQGLLIDGNPHAIQRCKKNILQSNYKGIQIIHGVVGWHEDERNGFAPFVVRPNELESSLADKLSAKKGSALLQVPVVDLEKEWLRHIGPRPCDLLKVDVEGAEKIILQKDSAFFTRVKRCVLEWHGSSTNRLEIIALLERLGFGEFEVLWDSPQAGVLACRNLSSPNCGQS